jgi:hypothetical protein
MKRSTFVLLLITLLLLVLASAYILRDDTSYTQPIFEPTEVIPSPQETLSTSTFNQSVIGQSVEGRDLTAYTFGSGNDHLLFVGGIHGGYEWNSILLAQEMIAHFASNTNDIPANVKVHIIPNLNPDGLYSATKLEGEFSSEQITDYSMHTTGIGRLNANQVDLNRNFDCKWQATGSWRNKVVSAGKAPFSEPEARALRDYINSIKPKAVVFWHSMAGNVYGSECKNGILSETISLMEAYAQASGYGEVPIFDAYPVTGDAEGWLASIGIPAVTVELATRTSTEWNKNLSGTLAVLELYKTN